MHIVTQQLEVTRVIYPVHLNSEAVHDIKHHSVVVITHGRVLILLEMQERTEAELVRVGDRHTGYGIDHFLRNTHVNSSSCIGLAVDGHEASEK